MAVFCSCMQGRDANEIKKVLDLLNKRINQVFGRDFPFYFCVVGRMMWSV